MHREEQLGMLSNLEKDYMNSSYISWVVDTLGNCISVNLAWLEFTKFKGAELPEEQWKYYVHPTDLLKIERELGTQNTQVWSTELQLQRSDGEYINFLTLCIPQFNQSGNLTSYLFRGKEVVTDQKQTIKDQSELTQAILDTATACIFMTDFNGICTYMNPAAEALLGQRKEEVQGRPLHECTHPFRPDGRPYPASECPISASLVAGKPLHDYEDFIRRSDGTFRRVICNAKPMFQKNMGAVLEYRDVTELEWSNRLLNIVNQTQTLFFSHQTIEQMFDWPLRQLLELTLSQYGFIGVVVPSEQGAVRVRLYSFISSTSSKCKAPEGGRLQELYPLEPQLLQEILKGSVIISSDELRWSPVQSESITFIGPFYKDEELLGLVGLADSPGGYDLKLQEQLQPFLNACSNIVMAHRHLQERMAMVEHLQLSEESLRIYAKRLEKSNKELEHFATIASHDLQEPLRKVMLFSDHLRFITQEVLHSEGLEDLDRIQGATHRMQHLISDLLDLSRVTRRGQPFKQVKLNDVIREVLSDLSYKIKETNAVFEVSTGYTIDADAGQMHQMLFQLIDNALTFHRKGITPSIKISIELLEGKYCHISVKDNGIGFKPEYKDKIFDVFQRVHGQKEYPGTGIGLSLVQKIVERHSGSIIVESIPDEGSIFIVTLPISQPALF